MELQMFVTVITRARLWTLSRATLKILNFNQLKCSYKNVEQSSHFHRVRYMSH
jgi:hypothetical protein